MKLFKLPFTRMCDDSVLLLYTNIVSQARVESFYKIYGVPDTVNGRFDLITLHMFIVLRRLKEFGVDGVKLSQDLFDIMFSDMDKNMREMGVGDLRVGKKVKLLAKAFYGRIKAYDRGIADLNDATLALSLKRNLFCEAKPKDEHVKTVTNYVKREVEASKNWSLVDIATNNISFGNI